MGKDMQRTNTKQTNSIPTRLHKHKQIQPKQSRNNIWNSTNNNKLRNSNNTNNNNDKNNNNILMVHNTTIPHNNILRHDDKI